MQAFNNFPVLDALVVDTDTMFEAMLPAYEHAVDTLIAFIVHLPFYD